ncbi:MAG: hypothetical protein ACR2FF_10380 [Mycobacteriales bacterium]
MPWFGPPDAGGGALDGLVLGVGVMLLAVCVAGVGDRPADVVAAAVGVWGGCHPTVSTMATTATTPTATATIRMRAAPSRVPDTDGTVGGPDGSGGGPSGASSGGNAEPAATPQEGQKAASAG